MTIDTTIDGRRLAMGLKVQQHKRLKDDGNAFDRELNDKPKTFKMEKHLIVFVWREKDTEVLMDVVVEDM